MNCCTVEVLLVNCCKLLSLLSIINVLTDLYRHSAGTSFGLRAIIPMLAISPFPNLQISVLFKCRPPVHTQFLSHNDWRVRYLLWSSVIPSIKLSIPFCWKMLFKSKILVTHPIQVAPCQILLMAIWSSWWWVLAITWALQTHSGCSSSYFDFTFLI